MIAVIFEVQPSSNGRQAYLDLAADLRAALQAIDGFISVERFESLSTPGKLLSLSFWRDEEARSPLARVAAAPPGPGGRPRRRVCRLPAARGHRAARLRPTCARRGTRRLARLPCAAACAQPRAGQPLARQRRAVIMLGSAGMTPSAGY